MNAAATGKTGSSHAETPILGILPSGELHLRHDPAAAALSAAAAAIVDAAFAAGPTAGLLRLGAAGVGLALPADWAWWRDLSVRFWLALRRRPDPDGPVEVPVPQSELSALLLAAPPLLGREYLDETVLAQLWLALEDAARLLGESVAGGDVQAWLTGQHPSWHAVGRVHLNLAEHKQDPERPFAFLATYTARLSAAARPQHLPLGRAVRDAAQAGDQQGLLSLLAPVQRAAAASPWLAAQVANGQLYLPVRWTPQEAFAFLQQVPVLEDAGLIVRMPQSWRGGRPARPRATATIGAATTEALHAKALLDFDVSVTLDGQTLTAAEIATLLQGVDGLQLLRGQWVEVDRARLTAVLHHFESAQARAEQGGLHFADALRLLVGAEPADAALDAASRAWAEVSAGPELAAALAELRSPQGELAAADPGPEVAALLRPYQRKGVGWLHLLVRLGLGACLADDMGLGKTLQVLALLLTLQRQGRGGATLVVMPASLLGNWQAEAAKFAPSLAVRVAHGSARPEAVWQSDQPADIVLTTYGTVVRDKRLQQTKWRLCVLDEAQAIKNPGTGQTQAVKRLQADARIAMTGTPIENRLGDLWSLMDFLNPGLLGSAKAFGASCKRWADDPDGYAPLRKLVQPYLLRRKKTDKSVVDDLPDKTEVAAYCGLSALQVALYQAAVEDLQAKLRQEEGMARRGAVLASLMRLKQICNHPSQWLGDGGWQPEHSGKFARLREIAQTVAERQEKMLVFTQFRETTAPLEAFLQSIFGQAGLVLHGQTPVRERPALVTRFQTDPDTPFFVLSLKAGGTGLNLTAASHVVHFDRWWNPAVEDQATDRAFRIGQKRNVLVHKFVCRGTVEERVEALINAKRALAGELLQGGGELALTELSDSDLMAMVRLDLASLGE